LRGEFGMGGGIVGVGGVVVVAVAAVAVEGGSRMIVIGI
jgi:hypothetical protein